MVPLDGFSLACNIFQAISFTRDVFKQVKEIVEQGKGDYDEDFISSKADRLTAFCSEIDDKTKAITRSGLLRNARPASVAYGSAFALPITFGAALPSALPSASDHKRYAELLEVADRCRTATKEFQDVIASLDLSSGKGDVTKALKAWAKKAWNRRKILKLENCMQEYEKLLDSVILKELLTKTNAIALQQRSDFAQLDSQLQKLIGLVLDGQEDIIVLVDELNTAITTRIDNVALEMKRTMANDGQATRDHVTKLDSSAACRIDNVALEMKSTVANDGQATRDHVTKLDSSAASRIGISTSAVTSAVSHEAVSTRGHIDARFRQAERRQRDERSLDQELRSFDKLLHSVQSNGANIRQAEVSDAHGTTYEWVFDPGRLAFRDDSRTAKGKGKDNDENTSETHLCNKSTDFKIDCFVCWLSGPQAKPYWVSGKPGSGKSTLMKYIARSPRTRSTLENIYGRDAMILSHFIYLHGQKEQRSRRGILLSLTHQYLSRISGDAAKIQLVQTVAGALKHQIPDIILKETSSEWSYGDLETLLLALLEDSRKVVIFIDGLDEVEVERQAASPSPVLSLIDKLCKLPRVHVCVSSRPEKVFHDKFADGIHLRLQDLTQHDISKYVADHLQQFYTEDKSRHWFLKDLVTSVWNQSDGVFLWACIVTKNLAEALSNGDDDRMVEERLKELPRDINDLYQTMLMRLKDGHKRYQQYASEYLQAVLRDSAGVPRRGPPIITDLLPENQVNEMLEMIISDPKCRFTWARLECQKFGKVVALRTSYLVEVDGCEVRLLHRSAADFLKTPDGQEILKNYDPSKESAAALFLWRSLLFAALQKYNERFLLALGGFIWHLEKNVLDSQPQLAISLLYVCQRLYYSRMPHDSPSTLAFPDVLKRGYCFNSFLAGVGVPNLLFYTMTIDIGSFKTTQGSLQNDWLSRRRLPLVYSPNYLLFLVYQSLVLYGVSVITDNGIYYINTDSDTYPWLMQNMCAPAKTQQPLKSYISLASIISTSILSRVGNGIKALQAALLVEGAWDETPICTLSFIDDNVCFDVYGSQQGNPTLTPPGQVGYVMQVSMGFLVYVFLTRSYRTSSGESFISDPLVDALLAEIKKRYPSGIPPARVFAGFQTLVSEDHRTRTHFKLSPDHVLHISMPRDPSKTTFTLSGKCLEIGALYTMKKDDSVPLIGPSGAFIYLEDVFMYHQVHKNTTPISTYFDNGEPEETSGNYNRYDRMWFQSYFPSSGTRKQVHSAASKYELKKNAGFFEVSSLDGQVVSKEDFMQEVSEWRETAFDYTT